jgi:alpha-beta hydrolase superfamily lysophospholipase
MVEQSSRQGDGEALVDYSLVWREPADARAASAVALVIHGLNVNPLRMDPLAHELNSWGVATLRCSLSGHANSLPAGEARLASLRQVTYGLWRDEAAAAYRLAAQQAEQRNAPMLLVAFSLGALIGCTAALHSAGVHFARLVLFAPALRIRRRSGILQLLSRWPQLVIRSLSPAAYRANPGTPIAAYNALYAAQRDFERSVGPQLNIPTLVFVDPRDEMVSYPGLGQLIAQHGLTQWQLQPVHKAPDANTSYHHLLIDRESVGATAWRQMMAQMHTHLGI